MPCRFRGYERVFVKHLGAVNGSFSNSFSTFQTRAIFRIIVMASNFPVIETLRLPFTANGLPQEILL